MSLHPQIRRPAVAALLLIAGLAPAVAQEDAFGEPVPYRERIVRRPARAVPPPAIISDYLPRNNAVPMYNEPPRRPSPAFYGR